MVRRFALDTKNYRYAQRSMQDRRFTRTETARKLRAHFTQVLAKRVGKLKLVEINRIYNWISLNDPALDKDVRAGIAETQIGRWTRKEQRTDRDSFAAAIIRLTSSQLGAEAYLGFLRRQLNEAKEEHHGHYEIGRAHV